MATNAGQARDQQREQLRQMASGDQDAVLRIEVQASGIDDRTDALTNFAALVTSGIPDPGNYVLHIARCLDAGCSSDEIIGTMVAITPNVGMTKMVAAAPHVAAALDIDLGLAGDDRERGDRFQRDDAGGQPSGGEASGRTSGS